jgi:hypothetical protein
VHSPSPSWSKPSSSTPRRLTSTAELLLDLLTQQHEELWDLWKLVGTMLARDDRLQKLHAGLIHHRRQRTMAVAAGLRWEDTS